MLIKENETKEIIKINNLSVTKEEFKKRIQEITLHSNIKFMDDIHNVSIETFGENEYFRISKIRKDEMPILDNGMYKIESMDPFIDLLLNFKFECLSQFKRDLRAELELFIEMLSDGDKEKLLMGLVDRDSLFL